MMVIPDTIGTEHLSVVRDGDNVVEVVVEFLIYVLISIRKICYTIIVRLSNVSWRSSGPS